MVVVKILTLTYGVCFNTYFFPLKITELADSFEKKGYEISPNIPFPRPPMELVGAGVIARKGKTFIHIDTRGPVLTITDVSVKSALTCFDEIANALKEDYKINLDSLVGVYEFNTQCEVPTEKKAYETITKKVRVSILDQIEKILDKKLWPHTLRFGGADMNVNSTTWFDFSIEPSIERNNSYVVVINYRNKEKEELRSFIESFEERISKIIELIDK
jgi:hypothetical protein